MSETAQQIADGAAAGGRALFARAMARLSLGREREARSASASAAVAVIVKILMGLSSIGCYSCVLDTDFSARGQAAKTCAPDVADDRKNVFCNSGGLMSPFYHVVV